MFVGYNISKANEAMENVNTAYGNVCKKVVSEWETVKGTLRREWVGADEQDFEKLVIDRLKSMLGSSKTLTSNTVDVLYELAVAWAKFQDTNTINGNSVGVAATLIGSLKKPTVTTPPEINFVAITFDASTNMGLANKGSDKTISDSLDTFVKNIKTEATNLFENIDMGAAFFGKDQLKELHKLRDTVGEAVGVIATSLKDFENAMKQLTGSAYDTSDQNVATSLGEAKTSVETSLNDLGETRWK